LRNVFLKLGQKKQHFQKARQKACKYRQMQRFRVMIKGVIFNRATIAVELKKSDGENRGLLNF
jgi:hypothetical protein